MEPLRPGDSLRLALRSAARSVAVVSCQWHCEDLAATVIAFSEVSLDPPTILICLNKRNRLFEPLQLGTPFCVNLLADHQVDTAAACGGQVQNANRFSTGRWNRREAGQIPYLAESQAALFCTASSAIPWGTHVIILANVEATLCCTTENPLLYVDGRYHSLGPERNLSKTGY
jgi:flavin reductase (DIM6/NTAB) family NADH-FMN oxidoreductase RutF